MLLTPAVNPDGTSEGFAEMFCTLAQSEINKTILEQLCAHLNGELPGSDSTKCKAG